MLCTLLTFFTTFLTSQHWTAVSIDTRIDVDAESIEVLEEEMFENTNRTGPSGNKQWGLDVGHHQDGWNPYLGVLKTWHEKKREGNEAEY